MQKPLPAKKTVMQWSIVLGILMTSACATTPDPDYAPVRPSAVIPIPALNGAIYQAGQELALFEDLRARRVGDILTIRLIENTNASKRSNTSTSKENEIALANPTLFGSAIGFNLENGLFKGLPLQNRTGNTLETGMNTSQVFDGSGSSNQSNSLRGSVSVSVSEVLANGNLVVRGEKLITLDQGDEYVRITGIVRPIDIAADNSVPSTKVAHAQITYGGDGTVADASKQGWLSKFFLKYWPF